MGGRPAHWYSTWRQWRGRLWIEQTARILYSVGIPAAALLWRGVLKEGMLGLQPFPWQQNAPAITALPLSWEDWLRDFLWILTLGVVLFALIELAQRVTQRNGIAHDGSRQGAIVSLREAVIHETHWAFYREPFILLWGINIGVWAGMSLTLLEAAVNPARWADLQEPANARQLLLRAALAVTSAMLFLLTQNFWLALLLHSLLGWWWSTQRYSPTHPECTSRH